MHEKIMSMSTDEICNLARLFDLHFRIRAGEDPQHGEYWFCKLFGEIGEMDVPPTKPEVSDTPRVLSALSKTVARTPSEAMALAIASWYESLSPAYKGDFMKTYNENRERENEERSEI